MSELASTFLRSLAIGAIVGLMIAASSYVCAYQNLRFRFDHFRTEEAWDELRRLREALVDFKTKSGRYPGGLEELDRTFLGLRHIETSGQILDAWGHPFEYRAVGKSFSLRSLGRDGRPGGVGLDEDIDSGSMTSPVPTLWQFTFDLNTGSVQFYCGLLGLIVLVVCVQERMGAPENLKVALIALPIVSVMTVWMASVMSVVHIPSGH